MNHLTEELLLSEAWLVIAEAAVTIAREPRTSHLVLEFLCAKTEVIEP